MSQALYPSFPGLGYPLSKIANWGTRMQRAITGRTLRTSDYVNPIWNFKLSYAVLEDVSFSNIIQPGQVQLTSAPYAAAQILDFFNARAGAFDDFLYEDPKDNTAVGQLLVPVPTDTTGTQFQLTRIISNLTSTFREWVIGPTTISTVYWNGAPQSPASYQTGVTGLIVFNSPPPPGTTVTADFLFCYRVYFPDSLDLDYFAFQLAELKQVKLTSVVL